MKTRISSLAAALGLFLALHLAAFAGAQPADFDAANRLYDTGQFEAAAAAYQGLIDAGPISPALYFNLGNAHFKSGKLGLAVAAYLQAEALSPRDPDIRANLRFAREQRQGPSAVPTRLERWLGRLTLGEWGALSAAAGWVFFGYLAATQLRLWPRNLSLTVLLGLALAVACAGTWLAWRQARVPHAVVITHEAVARTGPLEESPSAFTLQNGAELRVIDRKDEWLQVTANRARPAWVKKSQVVLAGAS